MSKDRETSYFDFIEQYEERLNLIYLRWEEQIADQAAKSKSKSLFSQIRSYKKSTLAGMTVALGAAVITCQYGATKIARWQQNRHLDNQRSLIASNSQKLNQLSLELSTMAAYNNRLLCVRSGDIYHLSWGRKFNHFSLSNRAGGFITKPNTLSVVKKGMTTHKPDTYLHLNPRQNLLFSSFEETDYQSKTESYVIDLVQDPEHIPLESEAIDNYLQVQSKAIALQEKLASCLKDSSLHSPSFPFPHRDSGFYSPRFRFPYAD